jgi:hypothetical protein
MKTSLCHRIPRVKASVTFMWTFSLRDLHVAGCVCLSDHFTNFIHLTHRVNDEDCWESLPIHATDYEGKGTPPNITLERNCRIPAARNLKHVHTHLNRHKRARRTINSLQLTRHSRSPIQPNNHAIQHDILNRLHHER